MAIVQAGDLHVCQDSEVSCIFHVPSMSLFRTSSGVAERIRRWQHGEGPLPAEISSRISQLMRNHVLCDAHYEGLAKLQLMITTDCNLRCTYCYADGGSYGLPRQKMGLDVAARAIELAFAEFGDIKVINFFGGEPLLASGVIEFVCDYVAQRCEKLNKPLPKYTLVTNMVFLPQRAIHTIARHKIQVTASVDGPPDVHDRHRVHPNGRGSFAEVAGNIRILRERCKQPRLIEATITEEHKRQGLTPLRLMRYLYDTFGIRLYIIEDSWSKEDQPTEDVKSIRERAKTAVIELASGAPVVDLSCLRLLASFVRKERPDHFCHAGITELSVFPDGSVFPCHLFAYLPEFRMGHVDSLNNYRRVRESLEQVRKSCIPKCAGCWARWLCRSCLVQRSFQSTSILEPNLVDCQRRKAAGEGLLLGIAALSKGQWASFASNLLKALRGSGHEE